MQYRLFQARRGPHFFHASARIKLCIHAASRAVTSIVVGFWCYIIYQYVALRSMACPWWLCIQLVTPHPTLGTAHTVLAFFRARRGQHCFTRRLASNCACTRLSGLLRLLLSVLSVTIVPALKTLIFSELPALQTTFFSNARCPADIRLS